MVRDPFAKDSAPAIDDVTEALDDEDCRAIAKRLESPMTASEISSTTDVPLSTTYRKLDLLEAAALVDVETVIRADGHHTTRYVCDFEAVTVGFTDDREFAIEIQRPARSADERLADLWTEVRKQT